jgi:rhodanese-related sulfurtransferase
MSESVSRFANLVAEAKKHINECTVADVKQMLEEGKKIHVIDVREGKDWNAGHVPGALQITKGVIELKIEKQVPDLDDTIVCYCGGGSRSALATENLQKMGYTNALSMTGGFRAWKDAGGDVE